MASVFKVGGRRLRTALITAGLLGALVSATGGVPAQAQTAGAAFGNGATTPFSAYSTGSIVHAGVLDTGVDPGPRIVDAEEGLSAAALNSQGLDSGVVGETRVAVVPPAGKQGDPQLVPAKMVDSTGKEAYGRGSGVEAGIGTDLPDAANQVALTQATAASHPPLRSDDKPGVNTASTGLVTTSLVQVPGGPLLYADALPSAAGAVWNPQTCIVGQPISFGRGSVAQAELIDAGGASNPNGTLPAPVISVDSTDQQKGLESRSFTYLFPNKGADGKADGTFGVGTYTEMILAPIKIAADPVTHQGALEIDVAGTWFFSIKASGKAPAEVQYGLKAPPAGPVPILTVLQDGVEQGSLTLDQLTGGTAGIVLPSQAAQLIGLAIGEDPRDIAKPGADPDADSKPLTTVTEGRGAVDVVRLSALTPGAPDDSTTQVAGLRVGHFEADVKVPEGGIRCEFPVKKEGSPTATVGQEVPYTITIPSDPTALDGIACKLTNITATDTLRNATDTGPAKGVKITNAPGAQIASGGQSATWTNLGDYDPNDPNRKPIVVTVGVTPTAATEFKNTVHVTATLGQCTGGGFLDGDASIQAFLQGAGLIGDNAIQGASIQGNGATSAPTAAVLAEKVLPTTGGTNRLFTGLGIAALLMAAGVYLFNKKVTSSTS
ncbi:MAG: hypothetical protein QOE35_3071 [Actinomycetota bacterium]|jgi:LPXTG-motif cell wall-anchored protein